MLVWDTTRAERRTNRQHAARTDREGKYQSPLLPAMKGSVTVIAEGFAPDMKAVDFAVTDEPVNFTLQKGGAFEIHFVDPNGKSVPHVEVSMGDLPSQPWRNGANIFMPKDLGPPR